MTNRSLAAQVLAAALCLSVPLSASAAQFQGEAPLRGAPGAVMPAAQVFTTPAQLQTALDLHFPAGVSADQALLSLSQAQAQTPGVRAGSAAAANALISAVAAPQGTAAALARSLPAETQARLAQAAKVMQSAAAVDSDFARELASLRAAAETPATARASAILPSLLKRAARLFKSEPELIAVPGGPNSNLPPMRPVGLMPSGGKPSGSGATEAPKAARSTTPVSKRVNTIQDLAKTNPEGALAEAESILGENGDARLEVRLAAIRTTAEIAGPRAAALLTKTAQEPFGWYERREAARALGLRAEQLAGPERDNAVEALKTAAQARNASLRLMSGWALQRFGVDPAPLMDKGEKLADLLINSIGIPSVRFNPNDQNQPPKKGSSLGKKLFFWAAGILLAVTIYSHLGTTNTPQTPPAPTAIHQVDTTHGSSISAAPGAVVKKDDAAKADTAKVEAPKPTEAQSLDQIAKDTKRTADAIEKLSKGSEKPAAGIGSSIGGMVINVLMWMGIFALITWVIGKMRKGQAGAIKGQLSQVKNKFERPDTKFSDVAGIDDALVEMEEIVDYLHNPAKYQKLGARVPKGVLMEGPPGTGKTLLARALAGESGATFISVSGSDFIEMFVGVGASRVRELFAQAKANKPAIIFIDELDAVAKKRDSGKMGGGNDEREQTVNAILAEMSGFDNSSGVIVIAATNRADVLDPAITRPGRFDRKIHVGMPDVLGREAILQVHARKARLSAEADLQFIARRTAGLSGAFLEGIINEAALLAARRGAVEIGQADLNEAVDRSTIGAKRNLFMPPELKRRVAFHESGHVIAGMLAGGVPPNKVTVIPHGAAALGFAEPGGQEDRYLYTQPELEQRLIGILGGLAAEKLIYGNTSTGPDNDLEQATRIARMMVERLGMSEKVGFAQTRDENGGFSKPISEETARVVDLEVARIVGEAQVKALAMLTERRDALDAMATELLERETLSGEDAARIVGPTAKK
jgi:cell division protease FtsH